MIPHPNPYRDPARWPSTQRASETLPRAPIGTPLPKRLLNSIAIDENGCWQWQRYILPSGYGRLTVAHEQVYAHRVSYEVFVGPIPEGLVIDHLCQVRSCINPFHLEPVTVAENNRRGRSYFGELTHCIHGHPFDVRNTYRRPDGHRGCRACRNQRSREYKARRRVAPELRLRLLRQQLAERFEFIGRAA